MSRPLSSPAAQLARLTQFDPNSGCWLYEVFGGNGYGILSIDRYRSRKAHRVAYELAYGPIPAGLVVDHKCRTRCCVNPAHLRAVTIAVNVMENSASLAALNRQKTHCVRGHEFTAENTFMEANPRRPNPLRRCIACRRERQRAERAARKESPARGQSDRLEEQS